MWAVVLYKGSEESKTRLGNWLTAYQRSDLARAMMYDVMDALMNAKSLTDVLVVTQSKQGESVADAFNVDALYDTAGNLAGAVTQASAFLKDFRNACGTFVIPGDVPLISAADIDFVLKDHEEITLIPDQNGIGTNGIVSSPPNAFRYIFDGRSFNPHQMAAIQAGYRPRVLRMKAFGLDVDTVEDAKAVVRLGPQTHTAKYLSRLNVIVNSDVCSSTEVAYQGS